MQLPSLMVAPNGASKTHDDHPRLPLTLGEVVRCARDCAAAGADGLHLHLRDGEGGHLLDSGAYREALAELARALPGLAVQVTTESGGRYGPGHQAHVALHSGADMVSVSVREICREGEGLAARLYDEAAARGIAIQHILYDREDAVHLERVLPGGVQAETQLIFVLGRYVAGQASDPAMLEPFMDWLGGRPADWAVCAFGRGETACLRAAVEAGGKMRVGFENSLLHADGTVAEDNAARVRAVAGFR
ncbi:3-keto-5-aminohexanoate cleavage protein [Oceanicola sp. 502str15]|uniref:3-keto-5-aminohexanoate cleavage protein n=1 Tax=Oceanicola sp. 502str15 TaxID=2696061 RepID=UPI00209552BA|nr:3-keto-5-aminohexanoate cleavage protein [Oceanicola sp. 502str15]MCO6384334.1 3-keto-5-aminohexanoate cleavage protein [Oceanicola sp. 502str15]